MKRTNKTMDRVQTTAFGRTAQKIDRETENAQVILCPVFLTSQEEKQFDKAALKYANNKKRLVLEPW